MQREEYEHYKMQEGLQQQQADSQSFVYAPQVQEQNQQAQAILVTETNPDKVIEQIELVLKNEKQNYDGSTVSLGEPIMNERGINRMRFIMRGVINQNTILSHLEEKRIGILVRNLADDLVDDLTLNWREYEVRDKVMLDHIVNCIVYPAYMALMRAYGQNEKNWLKGITVENIGGSRLPQPKKGGFWDKFKL